MIRLTGVVTAFTPAVLIMVGGLVMGLIPVAAQVGVMFMVVIGTFTERCRNAGKRLQPGQQGPECQKMINTVGSERKLVNCGSKL